MRAQWASFLCRDVSETAPETTDAAGYAKAMAEQSKRLREQSETLEQTLQELEQQRIALAEQEEESTQRAGELDQRESDLDLSARQVEERESTAKAALEQVELQTTRLTTERQQHEQDKSEIAKHRDELAEREAASSALADDLNFAPYFLNGSLKFPSSLPLLLEVQGVAQGYGTHVHHLLQEIEELLIKIEPVAACAGINDLNRPEYLPIFENQGVAEDAGALDL